MSVDWSRITFTEHMVEAGAVIAECQVVLDFGPDANASYEIKVYASLKGGGSEPYFAIGTAQDDPHGFRPLGAGETPEEALQACLANAGVFHRRRVKQRDDAGG